MGFPFPEHKPSELGAAGTGNAASGIEPGGAAGAEGGASATGPEEAQGDARAAENTSVTETMDVEKVMVEKRRGEGQHGEEPETTRRKTEATAASTPRAVTPVVARQPNRARSSEVLGKPRARGRSTGEEGKVGSSGCQQAHREVRD